MPKTLQLMKPGEVAELFRVRLNRLDTLKGHLLRIVLPGTKKVASVRYSSEYVRKLRQYATAKGSSSVSPYIAGEFSETPDALKIVDRFRQEFHAAIASWPTVKVATHSGTEELIPKKSIAILFGVDLTTVNNWYIAGQLPRHAIPRPDLLGDPSYGSTPEEVRNGFLILS